MKTINGIEIEALDIKQKRQMYSYCEEFQPYSNVLDVVFLEMVSAAKNFCNRSVFPFRGATPKERFDKYLIDDQVKRIKNKYYFNGIKYAKNVGLSDEQYREIRWNNDCPVIRGLTDENVRYYDPSEKELFMKVVRACRNFMRAKMSKEAEPEFYEKLIVVYNAMII